MSHWETERNRKMAKRNVLHVVGKKGSWDIKPEGTGYSVSHHSDKQSALEMAKAIAKSSGLGQVKVHGTDGKIQTEYTYGKDPRKIKG
jgi:hypothetical protein